MRTLRGLHSRLALPHKSLMRVRYARLAACLAVLAALTVIPLSAGAPAGAQTLSLCGNTGTPPPVQQVIVVMLENQSYSQIMGNGSLAADAPFQNSLAAQCGVAQDYFGATHTSASNYLAVSAGQYPAGSPPGCGSVSACATSEENIYDQLDSAGLSWRGYMESMPSNCDPKSGGSNTQAHDLYSIGHDPMIFYPDIPAATCQADDVAVPSLTAASGQFYTDLQNQTLPSFSLVVPNTVDDSEGPGTKAQNEQVSDTWLQDFISLVGSSPSYQAGNTLVLVAYDEGSAQFKDYAVGENCASEGADLPLNASDVSPQESCHMPLFVVYPYTTPGTIDTTFFDHYSITRTVEDLFGLPELANAASANSLAGHFGIPGQVSVGPTVAITSPAPGSTVSGAVTISGTATSASSTISQVQVSVDNGTPVTATGTTAWSEALNTAALTNGPHTVTATATDANGNTGSSSETINVQNAVTSSCPAPPSGDVELSGNVSVESAQTGWTGVYNSTSKVTRVQPAGGSYDGIWALHVAPAAGQSGTAGVNNASPVWEQDTAAGQAYEGSVFVSPSVAGEKVTVILRETTPGGTAVGSHSTTVTTTAGWQQITSAYTAKNAGDYLRYSVYASNFASSSQNFLADCLSLWTAAG